MPIILHFNINAIVYSTRDEWMIVQSLSRYNAVIKRNSSKDEIANVNFLYDDILRKIITAKRLMI